MKVSNATALALEMDSLLRLVADFAATDLGHESLLQLTPVLDAGELEHRRRGYVEVGALLGPALVPSFEVALRPFLARLGSTSFAPEGLEFLAVADLLEIVEGVRVRVSEEQGESGRDPFPLLSARLEALPEGRTLSRLIRRRLDGRGAVRDDATPELARLKAGIRRRRDRLYRELGEISQKHRDLLSEDTVPQRDGRLVLVLQAGAKGRMPGLVHGRSATGKSFYFEPLSVVEGNNELQDAWEEEEEEKRRILADLLANLVVHEKLIRDHAVLLSELDSWQAQHRYAEVARANLLEISEPRSAKLVGARHPLLDPRLADVRERTLGQAGHREAVVPLDLVLTPERRALVITGPNAGGKTVALKTLGLACLAHGCGLPVPAEAGSSLPLVSALVATVGDDQDLLSDRSTFSGRLLRLREVWDEASEGSLVLLDELGSGTDPEEGAALSSALLEALLDRGGLVVVTTHLGQLAALAMEREGASCAAMEFDAERGAPRYRLTPGPPGGSEALALARRLGLAEELISAAEERLGTEGRDYRRLVAEVSALRERLSEEEERLAAAVLEADSERERLSKQRETLEADRRRVGEKARSDVESFRRQVRQELEEAVDRLREQWEEGRRKGLAREATEQLFQETPEVAVVESPLSNAEVVVGERVRHRSLGWEGRLLRVERGRAEVDLSGKTFRCKVGELVLVSESPSSSKGRKRAPVPIPEVPESTEVPLELHLIGKRVEPALEELDRYLDEAARSGRGQFRIVHGHGTGRLRRAVRDRLRSHPLVSEQRPGGPGEGGEGATVVELR
ncbi:MAG: Smr/MutS family protein [Thermoanaerobaculia bacterium]|nr:Smr/MutS family protein [Thermoanaerobaculia bacterium]